MATPEMAKAKAKAKAIIDNAKIKATAILAKAKAKATSQKKSARKKGGSPLQQDDIIMKEIKDTFFLKNYNDIPNFIYHEKVFDMSDSLIEKLSDFMTDNKDKIRGVYLNDKNLTCDKLKKLFNTPYPNLRKITLNNNKIGDEGAKYLAEKFPQMKILEELNISKNGITEKGATEIAKGLADRKMFYILDISHNKIGDEGVSEFYQMMDSINTQLSKQKPEKNFWILDFSATNMGDKGVIALMRFIPNTVQMLILENNNITNNGANALAWKIGINNSVKELLEIHLYKNQITDTGKSVLQKSVDINARNNNRRTPIRISYEASFFSKSKKDIEEMDRKVQEVSNSLEPLFIATPPISKEAETKKEAQNHKLREEQERKEAEEKLEESKNVDRKNKMENLLKAMREKKLNKPVFK